MTHVYIDYKPDHTPFYVGMGSASRVRGLARRNPFHRNVCKKYPGWYRKTVETSSWDDCQELERFLISEIGRRDKGEGTLVNLTDGGDGVLGYRFDRETVERIAEKLRGVPLASEHREAIRRALKGRKFSDSHREKLKLAGVGKVFSNERRRRISLSRLNNPVSEEGKARQIASASRPLSEEHKLKVSAALKSALASPEARKLIGDKTRGKIWINNGQRTTRVQSEELEHYLADGWKRGRT